MNTTLAPIHRRPSDAHRFPRAAAALGRCGAAWGAFLCALLFLPLSLPAQDVLLTPTGISSATGATDVLPASQLIDGSGLSGTPTLGALGVHSPNSDTTLWATALYAPDYFANGGPPVVLTCSLAGLSLVSELIVWGFAGDNGEAKSFTVSFSTDGLNFGNPASVSSAAPLATSAVRLAFPGGPRVATHVQVTVTDNYFNPVAPGTGGGRVGLGELRFAGRLAPTLVVDNLANGNVSFQSVNGSNAYAQAFDTGASPVVLESVTVRLFALFGTARARVQLWSSAPGGTVPSALLEDLGSTGDFTSSAEVNYTVASSTHPVLVPATRYWVVLANDTGPGFFGWSNTATAGAGSSSGASVPFARATRASVSGAWTVLAGARSQQLRVSTRVPVTATGDSGPGSLRQALADAALLPGPDTLEFAPALSGQSIVLSTFSNAGLGNAAFNLNDADGVTLDATALPGGLTLTAASSGFRAFYVLNSSLTLRGLTLAGFTAQTNTNGAAIRAQGPLLLEGCTFSGNSARLGGAIFSQGAVTMNRCTLTGNTASLGGGALDSSGTLTLTRCTLTGNAAPLAGAIDNFGTLTLTHCTVSGNAATGGNGGAIYNEFGHAIQLNNSIVAGNTSTGSGADVFNELDGTVTLAGANVVQSIVGSGSVTGPAAIAAPPLLAPLGNYGGATLTMALLPASPARNAAVGSTATSDQRGFPIVGAPDLGAYEAGTSNSFTTWSWENVPSPDPAQHSAASDYDGDGLPLLLEYASNLSATAPNSGNLLAFTRTTGGTPATIVTFPMRFFAADLLHRVERTTSLAGPWTTIFTYTGATNGFTTAQNVSASFNATHTTLTDTSTAGQAVFYRLRVEVP